VGLQNGVGLALEGDFNQQHHVLDQTVLLRQGLGLVARQEPRDIGVVRQHLVREVGDLLHARKLLVDDAFTALLGRQVQELVLTILFTI